MHGRRRASDLPKTVRQCRPGKQPNRKTRDEIPRARRKTPLLSTHQGAPLTHFVQIDTVLGTGGGENRQSSQADSVGGFGGLTY